MICQTGIEVRARDATETVLACYAPAAVLPVGVAGRSPPELTAGDLVVCERVGHESRRHSVAEPLVKTGAMQDYGNFDQQARLTYVRDHPEVASLVVRQYEAGRMALGNLAIFLAAFLTPLIQHFHSGVR